MSGAYSYVKSPNDFPFLNIHHNFLFISMFDFFILINITYISYNLYRNKKKTEEEKLKRQQNEKQQEILLKDKVKAKNIHEDAEARRKYDQRNKRKTIRIIMG